MHNELFVAKMAVARQAVAVVHEWLALVLR